MEKNKIHVRRDDEVIVVSGDDRGKRGKVLQVSPDESKVIVNGINIVSKHVKPRRQGEAGGIVKAEAAMYSSKVMLYCSKCGRGVRAKTKLSGDPKNAVKTRVCAKCGADL